MFDHTLDWPCCVCFILFGQPFDLSLVEVVEAWW